MTQISKTRLGQRRKKEERGDEDGGKIARWSPTPRSRENSLAKVAHCPFAANFYQTAASYLEPPNDAKRIICLA